MSLWVDINPWAVAGAVGGLGVVVAGWLWRRAVRAEQHLEVIQEHLSQAEQRVEALQQRLEQALGAKAALEARLEEHQQRYEQQHKLLEDARARLSEAFKALASDALRANTTQFREIAGATLEPLKRALEQMNNRIAELERARARAYAGLSEQIKGLVAASNELRNQTGQLAQALRTPSVRGRWGEIQLKRVVELAGMMEHCDFEQQPTADDSRMRPDMIVHLPGEKIVVVDAKVPLEAYLEAVGCEDPERRRELMARHARQVRAHLAALGRKNYWQQFPKAPEFVVMFLPGESFFGAALEQDPGLIEAGWENRVLLASPTTLIALLRAVAYGWQQEQLARSAQQVALLGRQLHERLRTMAEHMQKMGRGLEGAVRAYNQAVGSLESRVMPAARRFGELGVGVGRDIPRLEPIQATPRSLAEPEED